MGLDPATASPGGVMDATRTEDGRALTLERYAFVLAHLLHFGRARAAEVLERLGVERRDFDEAELRVSDAMATESMRGEAELSRRFSEAFAAARSELAREKPELESLGAGPPEPGPPEVAPVAPALAGAPAPDGYAPPVAAREEPASSELTQAFPSPPADAPPRPPPPGPAFRPAAPEPAFDATHDALAAFRDPLPFSKDAAPSSIVRRPAPMRPSRAPSGEPGEGENATRALPAILVDKDETLPFFRPEAAGDEEALFSRLTLEQYASLCAELSVYRGSKPAVMRRYGLASERMLMALDAAWSSRMDGDARLRRDFEALFRRFSAWLSSQAAR